MINQDLYYLGDYGPDFIAAARWFVLTFLHGNGIASVWVHDGSFNPSKGTTQQSRCVRVGAGGGGASMLRPGYMGVSTPRIKY